MKVGFIATVFMKVGGTETWHRTLLPHIEGLTHFCVHGQLQGDLDWLPPNVKFLRGLTGTLRTLQECDIIVTWGITNLAVLQQQAGTNKPIIAVHHGDPSSTWAKNCIKAVKPHVARIVAVHPEVARLNQCDWIANAIDPKRIVPKVSGEELRERWGIGNKKICFWCARYSPEKNPYLAQRIAGHLPQDWVLVMAGLPPEGFKTVKPAIHVGQAHPGDWLSIASCFLSTSDQEGFGLSIGEAMLAKVPVVGTPVGLCTYPGVCKTFNIRTSRDVVATLITTTPPQEQIDTAYYLAESFSINTQAKTWNNLLKETHTLAIIP